MPTRFGKAAFSAAPTLLISGTATALAAAPTMTATARRILHGTASFNATATLTAAMPLLTAGATLTATATTAQAPSAHLAASPVLSATADGNPVALSANATLLAPGQQGALVLSGAAQLTTVAVAFKSGAASLAAGTALNATAVNTSFPAAALSAGTALTAAPLVTERAAAALTGLGALTATDFGGQVPLAAAAALAADAVAFRAAAASLTAPATLAADSFATQVADPDLSASAILSAGAFLTQGAQAALSASAALGVTATRGVPGSAVLSAPGVLGAVAGREILAVAALTAPGSLTATGNAQSAAHLAANPVLAAGSVVSRAVAASLSASATLSAGVMLVSPPAVALAAAPAMVAVPTGVLLAQSLMQAQSLMAVDVSLRVAIPPVPPRLQPTWQRDIQHYAIGQERQRHAQALWQYGELVMFCLLWRPQDIDSGIAQRCTRCYLPASVIALNPAQPDYGAAVEAQISAAYGQGNQYRCPLCYGTQIIAAQAVEVPGVRALVVRPAIFTDTDQNQQRTAKGVVNPGTVNVQSTPDFRVNTYDYVFRTDGRRYQLAVPRRTTLRTGFASPWQQTAGIDYTLASATLEDPQASVAYLIPPPPDVLAQKLGTYTRIPISYAWLEQINGPLIPDEVPPPAASGSYQPPVTLP